MKELTREAMKTAIPNWIVAILMGICAFYIKRNVDQMDLVADQVRKNQTEVIVLNKTSDKLATAVGTIDQICRNLEMRLVKLEAKEHRERTN